MFPFRELEVYDSFFLDGEECEKVGNESYLVYDGKGEPKSLVHVKNQDMRVDYNDDDEICAEEENRQFFLNLLDLIQALEDQGMDSIGMSDLRNLAEFALNDL